MKERFVCKVVEELEHQEDGFFMNKLAKEA